MNFKLLNLDNKEYEFNLGEITEQDWKYFLEDVVLNWAGNKKVHSLMANVVIRDNKAKIKLGYCDKNYHEICLRLDEFGVTLNDKHGISQIWQEFMGARFGEKYYKALSKASQAQC